MLCYLILIITALHDHRHCLPLAPSPHLPSSGDFRDLKIEPSKTELSINLSIFRVQPVTSLSIPLATTGCASTILIGINTFDSILPTSANYLIERCSSPCAPAMSSSTPGMWIITSQCNSKWRDIFSVCTWPTSLAGLSTSSTSWLSSPSPLRSPSRALPCFRLILFCSI